MQKARRWGQLGLMRTVTPASTTSALPCTAPSHQSRPKRGVRVTTATTCGCLLGNSCTHTCIHTDTHIHTCAYMRTHIHRAYTRVHIRMRIHTHVRTCMHSRTFTYMRTRARVHIHAQIHVLTCIPNMRVHIHARACACTYMHNTCTHTHKQHVQTYKHTPSTPFILTALGLKAGSSSLQQAPAP